MNTPLKFGKSHLQTMWVARASEMDFGSAPLPCREKATVAILNVELKGYCHVTRITEHGANVHPGMKDSQVTDSR